MTDEQQLQQEISAYTDTALATKAGNFDAFKQQLAVYINSLIVNDFSKLIFILYRLDISEKKLKQLLQENKQYDAGAIIADMIIERQQQKIQLRKQFKQDADSIPEEDKW